MAIHIRFFSPIKVDKRHFKPGTVIVELTILQPPEFLFTERHVATISSTSSSICSITSSIHNSISSLASSFPEGCIASSPISFRLRFRQAFHSSTSRLRDAVNSALTLLSSAASSSSKARLKSRRFFLICFCLSLLRRLTGRGRQINCLNRS